jgi:hypothetical protein
MFVKSGLTPDFYSKGEEEREREGRICRRLRQKMPNGDRRMD